MMPTDRQLDDRISRWLEGEAPPRLPDRVLRATFERTRGTSQQGRWQAVLWRMHVNRLVLGLAGAAAVVVVGLAALNINATGSGIGGPASPSPSPSPSAIASPTLASGEIPVGPHQLWARGVPMRVTIAQTDWFGEADDGIVRKNEKSDAPDGAGLIVFAGDPGGLYVYGDPCQWVGSRPAEPAGTVDAVVEALTAQASREATAPVDVTIDGHAGKSITLHVPDDADFSTCDQDYFASWGVEGEDPARWHQDPGQIDELWILDVDGELVVLDAAYYEGTPQTVVDELRAIVESTTFGE